MADNAPDDDSIPQNLPAVPDGEEPAEPMDTSFEVTLDDAPDGKPGPVHDGPGMPMPQQEPVRLSVLPASLRSVAVARKALARRAELARHHAAYHGIRFPWYLAAAVWFALLGAALLAARLVGWWWVAEASGHRKAADAEQWLKLHAHVRQVRKTRGLILLGGIGVLAIACALLALTVSTREEREMGLLRKLLGRVLGECTVCGGQDGHHWPWCGHA